MFTWATAHRTQARYAIILSVIALTLIAPTLHMTPTAAQTGDTTHTVQAGENLFRIALRYGYTAEYLAAVNGITDPTRIYAGQTLTIPDTAALPAIDPVPAAVDPAPAPVAVAAATAPVYHVVQAGETLASIGRAYGIGWPEIAAANGLGDPNTIFGGQQLIIPGTTAPGTTAVAPPVNTATEPAPAPVTNPAPANTQKTHVVQAGEHLAAIARLYNISWPAIATVNNITDPNHIYAGQTLIIPAVDDGQGGYADPNAWTPPAAAPPTITTGKQIIVDLSDQMTYAYDNSQLLRSTSVSTGLWGTPTVQGDYRVYLKYDSQLMSGPGYYLPGVPYVMYFYKGYSLHGTYWHSNFGQPMSHGCVNMPTPEAQWFYAWAEIGTPVRVQY
ncbi:MAG: LysM peptidoglycan-binding domain-containing protein [Anaerolineae bacterium]|nr:LysM peptidoglycan-binding domain-containing protein [Anaerolineae bacterium]